MFVLEKVQIVPFTSLLAVFLFWRSALTVFTRNTEFEAWQQHVSLIVNKSQASQQIIDKQLLPKSTTLYQICLPLMGYVNHINEPSLCINLCAFIEIHFEHIAHRQAALF